MRRSRLLVLLSLAAVSFVSCRAPEVVEPPKPVFRSEKLMEMDAAILQAIAEHKLPGGVLWLERWGQSYQRSYGNRVVLPQSEPTSIDTIFDAASLTKVIATTPSVLLLIERGRIALDSPASRYLPEFTGEGRESITVRHLLTHTSGLRPGLSSKPAWSGYSNAIHVATAEKPTTPPGTAFRYSDINFILLGELVQRVSGMRLNDFASREIFRPLKMHDTGFLPEPPRNPRIAPTEQTPEGLLRGQVHDPTSRRMGGVAGHAGLFTTAADLARFARMMLEGGSLEGARIFRAETVKLMTSVQSPSAVAARRGLGWDIDSPYSGPRGKLFPRGSYGHTGWTGTSLWIDPFSQAFVIFLSNRNHPDEKGSVIALRARLGTLAAEAVIDFDFNHVPGALPLARPAESVGAADGPTPAGQALNGIDVLRKKNFAPLRGLRVGLITNHTGTDRDRNPTIDLCFNAPEVQLKALFSPEHGIRGELDEKVGDSTDTKTGLPIYSLYGVRRSPAPEQLQGLDALVFDIQDIGCRFYTYISTMGLCMEAAARANVKFIVLDRVNPIAGLRVEGPVHTGTSSFTAFHSLPLQHGMTVGELAKMFNAERETKADLTVIPVENWARGDWFDTTGLPWINPSPNMRSLTAATLYPGIGLHETALSVGRGTGTPFEVVGAPYMNDVALAVELNRAGLKGLRFIPLRFTPAASTFKDKNCGGVAILVTDRNACSPVDAGIVLAQTLHRLYPREFALEKIQTLLQHRETVDAIRAGKTLAEIKEAWRPGLEEFKKRRGQFLIYP